MQLRPLLVAAFAVALVALPAQAGVERQPLTGAPAYEIDVPDGWQASRDESGSLYILAADHSGGLVLTMVTSANAAVANLDDLATHSLSASRAPPASRKEASSIGGVPGTAYYSSISEPSGAVSLKLILVKVDPTHVAQLAEIRNGAISPVQSASLDALAARVHFIQ